MKTRVLMMIVLLFSTVACGNNDTTHLQLNLSDIETYRLAHTIEQTVHMEMLGQAQETTTHTYTEIRYDVVETAADGSATIEVTYETIVMTQTDEIGREQIYDSRNNTIAPMESVEPTVALLGKPFTIAYGPNGKIIETYGLIEIIEANMTDSALPIVDPDVVRTYIAEMTDQTIKSSNLLAGGVFYPEQPIQVGQVWTEQQDLTVQFIGFNLENMVEVAAIEDNHVTLVMSSTGNVKQGDMDTLLAVMGGTEELDIEVAGDMQQNGTLTINSTTGLLESAQSDSSITITMTMMAIPIPLNIKMTSTIKPLS